MTSLVTSDKLSHALHNMVLAIKIYSKQTEYDVPQITVLKEMLQRKKQERKQLNHTYRRTIIDTKKDIHKISTTSPLVYTNMG